MTRVTALDVRFLFGAMRMLPLLPALFLHAQRIRAQVPKLPEARGPRGVFLPEGPSSPELQIVALGESTIAGVGVATHEEGFTGTFARELGIQLNCGVSWGVYAQRGFTAERVRRILLPRIREDRVDLFLIGLGANDAFSLRRPARWSSDIRRLIRDLRSRYPEAAIVFCNMPPVREFPAFTPLIRNTLGQLVDLLGDALRTTIRDFDDAYFFDERITLDAWVKRFGLEADRPAFFSDGVHPSPLTYRTWATAMARDVSAEPKIRRSLGIDG